MKILMVSLDYTPPVGGITAHVYELSQALKNIGCDVSVATKFVDKSQKKFETVDGIDIYRFGLKYIGFTPMHSSFFFTTLTVCIILSVKIWHLLSLKVMC